MVKISPNDFLTNCLQMGSTVKMEHFKMTTFRRLFSPSLLMIKQSRLRKSLTLVSSSMKKKLKFYKAPKYNGRARARCASNSKIQCTQFVYMYGISILKKQRCYYIVVYFLCYRFMFRDMGFLMISHVKIMYKTVHLIDIS